MAARAWWRDFQLDGAALHVRKTGARVPIEPGVIGETLSWLRFHMAVEAERRALKADGPRIWFAPEQPRPWYLVWPCVQLSGMTIAESPDEADIAFVFEDATHGRVPAGHGLPIINARCADVSKSRVAAVFEQVSGRALRLDPESWSGPLVVKSEANGAHDGRVVDGPRAPEPGKVYQRLIDNLAPDGLSEDLRCPTVDGEIAAVFLKRRPAATRFANSNAEVRRLTPDQVFNAAERALIAEFCRAFGMDWGGVDVLRDRSSGALWIVDANKTDMGPPTALPLADKLASARAVGARLRAYCERRLETAQGAPTP
jgi:hypothetical protein